MTPQPEKRSDEDIQSDLDCLWCGHVDDRDIAARRLASDVPGLLARLARVEALCDHTEAVIGDYVHVESIRAALAADLGSGLQS